MPSRFEKILFFLFVLLIPSQLGFHFWPSWSYVRGLPLDYLSPTLYLTDIFILSLFFVSNFRVRIKLPVLVFIILNIFFSQSPLVSIFRWIRISEYYWLFRYLIFEFDLKFQIVKWSLSASLIWSSLLAWTQFIHQSSMGGLWYWLGERTFNLATPGISKIHLGFGAWDLGLILRPYATFPHPNALAGFLLVAGLLLYYLRTKSLISHISILMSLITIPLTFSRTAIFIEFMILVYWLSLKIKNVKLGLILLFLLSPFLFLILYQIGNPSSLPERITQYKVALKVISSYPLFGVGLGSYIPAAQSFYNLKSNIYNLVFQPVHNLYFLLACEFGIPALIISGYFLARFFSTRLFLPITVVLISGLADHYWLTSHQNTFLLMLLFSFIVTGLRRKSGSPVSTEL